MIDLPYQRGLAVAYAQHWALRRNPAYYDFESIGGDCTNFASQCIYAGAGVMNFTPVTGWFYRSAANRSAAWTGVEYLYRFLINNMSVGPYAHLAPLSEAQPGDVVQLGNRAGIFYHAPVITAVQPTILVAAHTFDAVDKPLYSYSFDTVRVLHIDGVRNR